MVFTPDGIVVAVFALPVELTAAGLEDLGEEHLVAGDYYLEEGIEEVVGVGGEAGTEGVGGWVGAEEDEGLGVEGLEEELVEVGLVLDARRPQGLTGEVAQ